MQFRKHPTYVPKARNGYQLQLGVPKDVQPVIGKIIGVEAAGLTGHIARCFCLLLLLNVFILTGRLSIKFLRGEKSSLMRFLDGLGKRLLG